MDDMFRVRCKEARVLKEFVSFRVMDSAEADSWGRFTERSRRSQVLRGCCVIQPVSQPDVTNQWNASFESPLGAVHAVCGCSER